MAIQKNSVLLWLPYAALAGYFMCFMRVCFRLAERMELLGRENALFMVLCAGVVLGMLVPLPDINAARRKNAGLFYLAAAAVVPCTILTVYAKGAGALALILLTSFSVSTAMGCCLYRISLELEPKKYGLFFGSAFAASEGLLLIILLLPPERMPVPAAVTFLCLLPLTAAICHSLNKPPAGSGGGEAETSSPAASSLRSAPLKYIAALLLYCVMGGLLDNLTTFDDAFFGMPNMLRLIYIYSIAANLILGALFRLSNWRKLAMFGVVLICIGQALPYFSTVSALVVPYLAATMLGVIILEFIARAVPVQYAGQTRNPAAVSRMGYASLYGGFLITSIGFEYIPRGRYFFVMGVVLLLAIAILSLLYSAFSEEERRRYEQIMRELRAAAQPASDSSQPPTTTPDIETRMEQLGLTPREREVCALLLGAYPLKQVAYELQIAYATVNKHNTNIYRKLNINSKAELFQIFGVIIPAARSDLTD